MRRIVISTLALAALVALPAAPATAGGRHRDFRGDGDFAERMGDRHSEKLTRALDLTVDQQRELDRLQEQHGDTVRPLFDSMRTARSEMESLLETANPDPAAVGAKAIALHRAKEQMKAARESFEDGIVAMLNETQRAQYEALRDARGDGDDRGDGPDGRRHFDRPMHGEH